MQIETKLVDFYKYCALCKYKLLPGNEDPCNECLTEATNINSQKPVNFKES